MEHTKGTFFQVTIVAHDSLLSSMFKNDKDSIDKWLNENTRNPRDKRFGTKEEALDYIDQHIKTQDIITNGNNRFGYNIQEFELYYDDVKNETFARMLEFGEVIKQEFGICYECAGYTREEFYDKIKNRMGTADVKFCSECGRMISSGSNVFREYKPGTNKGK